MLSPMVLATSKYAGFFVSSYNSTIVIKANGSLTDVSMLRFGAAPPKVPISPRPNV